MLETVDLGRSSSADYRGLAPDGILDELERIGSELRGLRVLHVNATPYGGGVSELLRSTVPLLNDIGLVAEWRVIGGDDRLFRATKRIHNGLQGASGGLSGEDRSVYEAAARRNAGNMAEEYDVVFVHDPQPAAIPAHRGRGAARWIWRCHIDTSAPDPEVWDFLRPFLVPYDAAVFTLAEFVPHDLPVARVVVMPPAIDPLSPKNMLLPEQTAHDVLNWIGLDAGRPLVTQVSRFDPWKDPLGVIAAYRLAREQVRGLQLALAGSMALDDPEGWEVYRQIREAAAGDPRIHLLTNLTGVGNIEVNALQRLSRVVVQKSVREGFGLVVSEALWKRTPVVAGRTGGIPLQMADGAGGFLVESVDQAAAALVRLLDDAELAEELAERGWRRVRDRFLIPRLVLDELRLAAELLSGGPPSADRWAGRDPVCGMTVADDQAALRATVGALDFVFCSDYCQSRFLAQPAHFGPSLAAPGAAP